MPDSGDLHRGARTYRSGESLASFSKRTDNIADRKILMPKFRSLAFDLDDTLLDTSSILIPSAAKKACEAMLAAGLQCELSECLQMRQELAVLHSHTEIFSRIMIRYGARDPKAAMEGA